MPELRRLVGNKLNYVKGKKSKRNIQRANGARGVEHFYRKQGAIQDAAIQFNTSHFLYI